MYSRNLRGPLEEALGDTPVVLLHGARQTGKSTLARAVFSSNTATSYLTLDDSSLAAAAQADPAGFLAGLDGPVVIDEVQRAPALFPAIKAAVDRDRRPGRFLLTGSANVLTLPRLSESLAGRMEILELWPLSQGELEGRVDLFVDAAFDDAVPRFEALPLPPEELARRIAAGGYPEAVDRATERRRRDWFVAYTTTILQRDVRDLANVEGLAELPQLLRLVAARTGNLLNYADLSRGIGLPQTTLKRYFALLEASFLVRPLPAWFANASKRLLKSPKVTLNDTGLTAALLGLGATRLAADRPALGPLLESWVVLELHKQASWSETRPTLYHYRNAANNEVDIVLEDASGRVVGIEVKAAATVSATDFRGLRALAQDAGTRFHRGLLAYTGDTIVPFGSNMHALPLSGLWRWQTRD